MPTLKNEIVKDLKKLSLKITKERKAFIDLLLKIPSHFCLNDLVDAARKNNLDISRASIYRNIPFFEQISVIKKVSFYNGQQYYEVAVGKKHHEHIFCRKCHRNFEFDDSSLNTFFNKIFKKFGFLPEGHKIELWGLCPNCQSKITKIS